MKELCFAVSTIPKSVKHFKRQELTHIHKNTLTYVFIIVSVITVCIFDTYSLLNGCNDFGGS